MSSRLKEIIIVLLLAAFFIEFYLNNILSEKINEKPITTSTDLEKTQYKDLSQLNREISSLNNAIILNANKENNIWCIQVKLSGSRQEILDEMKKIEKYEIKNYIISKNNGENYVIIDIYGNEQ